MKLLWLCNMVPGKVKEAVSGGSTGGGLWVDSVLEGLLEREDLNIRILCPGDGGEGKVNARCSYAFFSEGLPYVYLTELETQFRGELDTFQPDVIHYYGIRASELHLVQIHIAAIGKIVSFFYFKHLLPYLPVFPETLIIAFVISPCPVPFQICEQMFPDILIFWSNQTQP